MRELSALYLGSVFHRRLRPKPHGFRYALFWWLIDLDEIAALDARLKLFSHNRWNWLSLRDSDHGDGSSTPLKAQAETLLRAAGLHAPGGRIALLCMPRAFGVAFNPLSLYFCFDAADGLTAIIHQVHNTFGGRHAYVLAAQGGGSARQTCQKSFFVSPFLPMGLRYAFDIAAPGERMNVAIRVSDSDGPLLRAAMTAKRADLTDRALLRAGLQVPLIGVKTLAAIHFEALRLWLKGVRFLGGPGADAARLARRPR